MLHKYGIPLIWFLWRIPIVNWLKLKFALKAEAELRHIRLEKDKYQSEYTRKVEHVGGDFDKLTVN